MKSIRWKLVTMYIALVFIVMLISGVMIVLMLRNKESNDAQKELGEYAKTIKINIIEDKFPAYANIDELDLNIEMFQEKLYNDKLYNREAIGANIQAAIINYSDYSYRTIAWTDSNDWNEFPQFNTRVIISAADGTEDFGYNSKMESSEAGIYEPYYEYAEPYKTDDGIVRLIIYVRKNATASNDNLLVITYIIMFATIVALIFFAVLGMIFANYLTVPLQNLSKKAKEFAKGDLNQRVEVVTKDEIGQLNESFNFMASELSEYISKHIKIVNTQKEFVANVSHELRTPLTTIKGYTETLIENSDITDDVKMEFLQTIENEADRMTAIVRDLLDLSRMDDKQMDFAFNQVDLSDLVATAVKRNSVAAKKLKKSVTFERPQFEASVEADEGRVGQVLNNIITNSLRYSDENAAVNISVGRDKKFYSVIISDNGFGIPEEDAKRIFERFYRVDKARSRQLGGTGLGLSIAKEIMEEHGGNIICESEIGKGTTMTLMFPVFSDLSVD